MKFKPLTTAQKDKFRNGQFNVSAEVAGAVLNVLAHWGNQTPVIQGKTHEDVKRAGGITHTSAVVSHAVRYLQWAKNIDVAKEGQSMFYFVRNPVLLPMGQRVMDCHFPDLVQIPGFPFRYADRTELFAQDTLDVFNAFTQFRKGSMEVKGVTHQEVRDMARNHCGNDMSSKRFRVALDRLVTWGIVTMKRKDGGTHYRLAGFTPGTPGRPPTMDGFNYAHVPLDVPFPEPGYLGELEVLFVATPKESNFQKVDKREGSSLFVPFSSTGEAKGEPDPFLDRHTATARSMWKRTSVEDALDAQQSPQSPVDAQGGPGQAEQMELDLDPTEGQNAPVASGNAPVVSTKSDQWTAFLLDMASSGREVTMDGIVGLVNQAILHDLIQVDTDRGLISYRFKR